MNSEQAAHLVDKWAREWRQYLDGMLHKYPRQALIDLLVAVSGDADASEDLEGRTVAIDVKSISAKVRRQEIEAREPGPVRVMSADEVAAAKAGSTARAGDSGAAARWREKVALEDAAHELLAVSDKPAEALTAHDDEAMRDAFALLMQASGGRALYLTERQVERFKAPGLLEGVAYEVFSPMPLASDPEPPPAPPPRKVGRPAKRR